VAVGRGTVNCSVVRALEIVLDFVTLISPFHGQTYGADILKCGFGSLKDLNVCGSVKRVVEVVGENEDEMGSKSST
jgi:hypothetical protein